MSDSGELTLLEIYNQLFAGKHLRMSFNTRKQMEEFRRSLHKVKKQQEAPAVAVGMIAEEDRQQLKFVDVSNEEERMLLILTMEIFLTAKPQPKKYVVQFVDDNAA